MRNLLTFAVLALAGAPVVADGVGAGGGKIYYSYKGQHWSMNPDGTGKTALAAGVSGEPSTASHGGQRWFAQIREIPGETYPDGRTRNELFAVREDGNPDVTRQLTTQPGLQVLDSVRWKPGDAGISWVARRWSGGEVLEGGIYAAAVVFDADGNVSGLDAQPAAPAVAASLSPDMQGLGPSLTPDVKGHDWSPDGSRVVHARRNSPYELRISGLSGSSLRLVAGGTQPRWSPDGGRIAYWAGGVYTISPDGSGAKLVSEKPTKQNSYYPVWSPSGSHLAYSRHPWGSIEAMLEVDIYRVTAAGRSRTNLTGDLQGTVTLLGWR
jgi:hypothetical protein